MKFGLFFISFFLFITSDHLTAKLSEKKRKQDDTILFDGLSLKNWEKTDYAGKGEIRIDENRSLILEMGAELSGLNWKGGEYEIR